LGGLLELHKSQGEMDQRSRVWPAMAEAHPQSTHQYGDFFEKERQMNMGIDRSSNDLGDMGLARRRLNGGFTRSE
jgi:hypothetical protein